MFISLGKFFYLLYSTQLKHNIILFYPRYEMGGSERVHADILEVLSSMDPLLFICYESEDKHFFDIYKKFSNKMLDIPAFDKSRIARYVILGYLSSMINDHKSKVVLFGAFCLSYYELLLLLKEDKYIAIDILHNLHPGHKFPVELSSLPYLSYLSKRVVISPQVYEGLKELYFHKNVDNRELKKIEVIENGVDVPNHLYTNKNIEKLNILYVGRCSKEKRIDRIGKIAYTCNKLDLPVKITLVGVDNNCMEKKYRDYCYFTGKIKNPLEYYKKAHILLITSLYEGFPMVIMEAMSYGVIPISTDVGGIGYHIKNGVNGFLIDEKDEEKIILQFVNHIQYLIKEDEFKKLSSQAYNYSKNNFSKIIFQKKYKKLFTNYLNMQRI